MSSSTHENDTSRWRDTDDTSLDATALRLLNLLFMLHTAPSPLTTSQIIGSAETGYGSDNRESDARKFNRDREHLRELGVFVREVTDAGASEREESRWEIDRVQTHAQTGVLEREDVEAVLAAIDEHFSLHANDPVRWPLQRARTKLVELSHEAENPRASAPAEENLALRHVWSAYRRRRAARFTYAPAGRPSQERTVEIYSFFTRGVHTYLVGKCCDSGKVHTFRTDRITAARKTPQSAKPYTVPSDFELKSYKFLPFDFSSAEPIAARFSFPASLDENEIRLLTNGRGTLTAPADGSRWLWDVEVRDLGASASFALEHHARGMRVEAPEELVSHLSNLVKKAVSIHAANR